MGEGGPILRTTNGGVTFVEQARNTEVPSQFSLDQNYPNPFNPSTIIKYQIPSSNSQLGFGGSNGSTPLTTGLGVFSLKVFDILGREVATLVNDQS
ncbi:MAG: hypothetical protein HY961_06145 [Ignavibacteriae bacterium]|nr:hypothetical protein [Ignavibacteriota bacterium]